MKYVCAHDFLYSIFWTLTSLWSWYTYMTMVEDWMSIKTKEGTTSLQSKQRHKYRQ